MTFAQNRRIAQSVGVLLAAVVVAVPSTAHRFSAEELPPATAGAARQSSWDAVALGRVEPRSREIKITAPVPGRIADVLVKGNDNAFAGELLVRLDDEEAMACLAAADARVA